MRLQYLYDAAPVWHTDKKNCIDLLQNFVYLLSFYYLYSAKLIYFNLLKPLGKNKYLIQEYSDYQISAIPT